VAELTPTYVVVEAYGVGYLLNISLNSYDELSQRDGQAATLVYVYEAIREDAHVLYGFVTRAERDAFVLLISVSGVGGNTARMILSALTADELCSAIGSGDVGALKMVKGVGAKTAQRIIVDLKDKIKSPSATLLERNGSGEGREAMEEALAALVMLGFTRQASEKALTKLFKATPGLSAEAAIKAALKML